MAETEQSLRQRRRAREEAARGPERALWRGEVAQQAASRMVLSAISKALTLDELAGQGEAFRAVCRSADRQCARSRVIREAVARWPHAPLPRGSG